MNMLSDIWHRTEEWLKEGLDELRIVTIIFLGITIIGALLLMTPLPKTVVLWSSFVASVMIPVFMVRSIQTHQPFIQQRSFGWIDDSLPSWPTSSNPSSTPQRSMTRATNSSFASVNG